MDQFSLWVHIGPTSLCFIWGIYYTDLKKYHALAVGESLLIQASYPHTVWPEINMKFASEAITTISMHNKHLSIESPAANG